MTKVLVQFLRPWSVYAVGDTVAFDADRARTLMDRRVAQVSLLTRTDPSREQEDTHPVNRTAHLKPDKRKPIQCLYPLQQATFRPVYEAWRSAQLTQAQAARKLGVSERSFRRYVARLRSEPDA